MRTSQDIYHQIRWDSRFDPARFTVLVDMHRDEPKRVPFVEFTPGGDIPWHRVLGFEADGVALWDRRRGIDRLGEVAAGRAHEVQLLRPPAFDPHPLFRFRGDRFQLHLPEAAGDAQADESARLRVVTWNTLWDRYDADRIDSPRRRAELLRTLASLDADVIALQEVEPVLADALLREDWVREGYLASDDESGTRSFDHGLLLLSRAPIVEMTIRRLGPHKAALAAVTRVAGRSVVIVSVHLTSDHSAGARARRHAETEELMKALEGLPVDLVWLGDFNDGRRDLAAALECRDAWHEIHGPDDETPTFHPARNPLAAIASLTGEAKRLDRVLLRGDVGVGAASLVGDLAMAPDGLFVSDHFAVQVDLAWPPRKGTRPAAAPDRATARTALSWLPDDAAALSRVQRARACHDPRFDRWPPHVNVRFGFVPESSFDDVLPGLAEAASRVEPFQSRLEGVRSLAQADHATLVLEPDPDGGHDCFRSLFDAFGARGARPHLTVGRCALREPTLRRMERDLSAEIGALSLSVAELTLLSRRGDEPMRPRVAVRLGRGAKPRLVDVMEPDPRPLDRARPPSRERLLAIRDVVQAIRDTLAPGVVHLTGSHRVGAALAESDVDLVAAVPSPCDPDRILDSLARALPPSSSVRRIVARVPGLELRVGDIDVDLALVDAGLIPPTSAVDRRSELGESAALALSAVSDADALLDATARVRPAFDALARHVKAWARRKGVDSAPFCGVPSIGWLVMAARTARRLAAEAPLETVQLLRAFFEEWAVWDCRAPIHLSSAATELTDSHRDGAITIMTPSAPVRSATDGIGAAGTRVVMDALLEGWEVLDGASALDDTLAAKWMRRPELHRRHAAWAVLHIEGKDERSFAHVHGAARGRVKALIRAIEAAGVSDVRAWPRPFALGPTSARYAIGLGRHPLDARALVRIAAPMMDGLLGARVEWADNGEVPTL